MNPRRPTITSAPAPTPRSWVLRFDPSAETVLASLRRIAGLELAQTNNALWLRGTSEPATTKPPERDSLQRRLDSLPASARYETCPGGRLRQVHQIIPTEYLPTTTWVPIADWFEPQLPVAAWPAATPPGIPLRLIPSTEETELSLVLVHLRELATFVTTTARIRFEGLRFATSADGTTLVQGLPIPPLPGTRFSVHEGVAVPAGFTWSPPLPAKVMARCLAPPTGGLALWHPHGEVSLLHPEQLLPLTRAAIGATAQALSLPP